jgi:hypothetical protein
VLISVPHRHAAARRLFLCLSLVRSRSPEQAKKQTDSLQTRMNTGPQLWNVPEVSREQREKTGRMDASNDDFRRAVLKRPGLRSAPILALRPQKIPADKGWDLWGWWPSAESNHGHADFQSAALPTELLGQRGREYSQSFPRRQKKKARRSSAAAHTGAVRRRPSPAGERRLQFMSDRGSGRCVRRPASPFPAGSLRKPPRRCCHRPAATCRQEAGRKPECHRG